MDLPSLPTDSVYKFKAVAGLVMIAIAVLAFALVFDRSIKLMHDDAQAADKLFVRSLELAAKLARPDEASDGEIAGIHAEMKHISSNISLLRGRTEAFGKVIHYVFWLCTLLTGFGLVWHFFGMRSWSHKLQRHQDRLLELQVKAQEKAVSAS